MVKMSLDEYLGKQGCASPFSGYSLDKCRIPHGETERQKKQNLKTCIEFCREYSEKRQRAIEEYNQKVEKGEIVPKTKIELLIDKANGHPDNASTQAARRMCEKRGVNWREKYD